MQMRGLQCWEFLCRSPLQVATFQCSVIITARWAGLIFTRHGGLVVVRRQKIFINHHLKIMFTLSNANRNCLKLEICDWPARAGMPAVHFTQTFKPQSQDRAEDSQASHTLSSPRHPPSWFQFPGAEIFPIPWLCCSILFLTVSKWSMEYRWPLGRMSCRVSNR